MAKRVLIFLILISFIAALWVPPTDAFLSFLPGHKSSKLDQKSEEQANAYNEQAVELFEQGRFEEAQQLWEKALDILERPTKHAEENQRSEHVGSSFDEKLLLMESEEELEEDNIDKMYDMAVKLFKEDKYVASKRMFEGIEQKIPDYKATRNYLTILEHKIKQAQQNLSGKSFQQNAVARREERAEWERILEESRMELEKKLAEQADPIYREAVDYYKSREFKLAKDYFNEVNNILPGHKDTKRYLSRIDKDIRDEEQRLLEEKRKRKILARKKEKEEWKRILEESERELKKKLIEQVNPIYEEALLYYKKREFELAKSRFEEAQVLVPNYKSTAQYLERIDQDVKEEMRLKQVRRAQELERQKKEEELARKREEERLAQLKEAKEKARIEQFKTEVAIRRKEREEWLKTLQESEKERQRKLKEQARFVYQEAVKYYKKRRFEEAKEDFLEVRRMLPDYKSTEKYLARIDEDIAKEQKERYEERQRIFRRKMRNKKLMEQQKWEEEQKLRAQEEQQRLEEFKEKALAREKQRAEWERILRENERERQKKLEEEAEFIYQEALRSYQAKHWEKARENFIEVERIIPGYKLTEKYLAGIDDDILKEEEDRRGLAKEALKRHREEEARTRAQEEQRQAQLRKEAEERELERKEAQAEAVYQFALSLYKRGNYQQAKDKFLETEMILSGYKATEKYLKRVDEDIEKAKELRLKEQRIAFERQIREQRLAQKREEDRIARLRAQEEERKLLKLREEALLREKERKEWEKTIQEIEKEHQKRLKQQADSVYEEALRYYKAGWYEQAKETLEEVHVMWPGYKSTEKYLAKIDSKIRKDLKDRRESETEIRKRQEWQEELAKERKKQQKQYEQKTENQRKLERLEKETIARRHEKEELRESMDRIEREYQKQAQRKAKTLYRKAVKHYKAKEFELAKMAFIDVEKTLPDYKSTSKYLERIDKDIRDEKRAADQIIAQKLDEYTKESDFSGLEKNGSKFVDQASRKRQKEFTRKAEEKYREALSLYKAKEFIQAKMKFIEVESMSPGYKATLDFLGRIDQDISEQKSFEREKRAQVETIGSRRQIVQKALSEVEERLGKSLSDEVEKSRREEELGRKQSTDWIKHIEDQRDKLRRERLEVQKEYEQQFKGLYTRAVKLYRKGSYKEARALFLQIEQMKPGYKRAASYLKKAEAKIKRGLQKDNKPNVVLHPKKNKTRYNIIEETLSDIEQNY